jgi:hypothetical protein
MIEDIKIATIETKSGMSKTGRGYNMVIILAEDGRKMSCYIDKEYDVKFKKLEKIADWKPGMEVKVKVEQNGDYLNFDLPSKNDLLEERLINVEKRLSVIEIAIRHAKKAD